MKRHKSVNLAEDLRDSEVANMLLRTWTALGKLANLAWVIDECPPSNEWECPGEDFEDCGVACWIMWSLDWTDRDEWEDDDATTT